MKDLQEEQMSQNKVEEEQELIWYFAIGSMMNPTSCALREFHPKESHPAKLLDYEIQFFSSMGFAEAVPSKGSCMHGVVHHVTKEQMKQLDTIELGYIRQNGTAELYHGGTIPVTVYCRPRNDPHSNDPLTSNSSSSNNNNNTINRAPRQRYLEILIAGAKHWGVDPEYVRMLERHDFQPRQLPHEFLTLEAPPAGSPHYETVPESTDTTLYCTLNGKLLEITYPKDHSYYGMFRMFFERHGPHLEIAHCHLAYDIKYGVPRTISDVTREHAAYIEDAQVRYLKMPELRSDNGAVSDENEPKYFRVIGTYAQKYKDENDDDGKDDGAKESN